MNLYEVLGVERAAAQDEIKKAYYKLALRLHPDKCPDDKEAHAKFQRLQEIYGVLGDPERRKIYDDTGATSEDLVGANFDDLRDYFRAVFKRVTEDDIDTFASRANFRRYFRAVSTRVTADVFALDEYRGSEEEKQDVLKTYTEWRGDMRRVFERIMCSDEALDSHRFMDMLQGGIEQGTVRRFKVFSTWAAKVQAQPRPADPLQKRRGRSGSAGTSSLAVAIKQKREEAANALFASLEAKYGGGDKAKKKRKGAGAAPSEPSEEEFQALQARMFGGASAGASGAGGAGLRDADAKENGRDDAPRAAAAADGAGKMKGRGGKGVRAAGGEGTGKGVRAPPADDGTKKGTAKEKDVEEGGLTARRQRRNKATS